MSYLWMILISCVLYYAYHFFSIVKKLITNGKTVDQFPLDKKHWFKGHLDKLSGQGEKGLLYFEELARKYPKACGIYFINFLRPCVVVHHPDTVKVVLKAAGKKPTFFGLYRYGLKWPGDGLLLSSGEKWHRNRRLLTPTFHFDSLKNYINVQNRAADVFLENISAYAQSNESFHIFGLTSKLSLDIILQCAFSYKSDLQTRGVDHFYNRAVNVLATLIMKRQYEPWKHFDFIYWMTKDGKNFWKYAEEVGEFSMGLIKERRKQLIERLNEKENHHDFLDILVRSVDPDGVGLTDEEIRDEVNTFILGGNESTASAMSWSLYCLASNPHHQRICQEEIEDLLRDRNDDYIRWDDLQKLPYLTMCIKESQRLYGIPYLEKELEEDVFIDGKSVPAGTVVSIVLYSLHRNPHIWDEPWKFDPERFSHERSKSMDPFAFIPFSAGFRNCIGQAFAMDELKVVLARTLKRFNFDVKENHKPLKLMAMTMKSSNGIYLTASDRMNSEGTAESL